MSHKINHPQLVAEWLDRTATPTDRWYKIDDHLYVSTSGRAVTTAGMRGMQYGEPVRRLQVHVVNGSKYVKRHKSNIYTRTYLDEALAVGELVPVTEERIQQWAQGGQLKDPNEELDKEAKRLALWLLEDEAHPDFNHYVKVMREALVWGKMH